MQTRDYEGKTWAAQDVAEERAGQSHSNRTSVVFGDPRRAELIRETYRLLAVGVFCAMAGGWIGARTPAVIEFFSSLPGLLVALLALNTIPVMGLSMARKNPRLGVPLLAFQGLTAGLVMAPLLFVAMIVSGAGDKAPNLIQAALVITAAVFAGISYYVWRSGDQFDMKMGMMRGAFFALVSAVLVNAFWLHSGTLGLLISCAVGLFGAAQLTYSTGQVLNNREFNDPVLGALALFAGLFNLFTAILRLLMGSSRR